MNILTILKIKIYDKWIKFISIIKNLFIKFCQLMQILTMTSMIIFLIYTIKIHHYKVNIKHQEYKNIMTQCDYYDASYLNIYQIPLLKAYSYQFSFEEINLNFIFRIPKFIWNNEIYDEEGIKIQKFTYDDNININSLIKIQGSQKNFLPIYMLFQNIFEKTKYRIHLEYVFIRWNILLYDNDHMYMIKLPTIIDSSTHKKIDYIYKNINDFFDKRNKIIDLRFDKNIYIIK
jgi:hypothetical protein